MPSNPSVLGEDIVALAWEATGAGAAEFVNAKMVGPIMKQVIPGASGADLAGKMVDAVSTGVSGYLVGEGVGMIDGSVGRRMRRGGVLLAVAKAVAAFVPGFSLSATLPSSFNFALPGMAPPKALPAANGNGNGYNNQPVETRLLGFQSMGI